MSVFGCSFVLIILFILGFGNLQFGLLIIGLFMFIKLEYFGFVILQYCLIIILFFLGFGIKLRVNVVEMRVMIEIIIISLFFWYLFIMVFYIGMIKKFINGFKFMRIFILFGESISCLKYKVRYGKSDFQVEKKKK